MPYVVKDWESHFENSESRKVKHLRWVPMPNRHDGKGYRRLLKHPRHVEIFCAWCLILQVASRMPVRGTLADEDGDLNSEDLADKTGFASELFDLAFNVLSSNKIGWIRNDSESGEHPGTSGEAGAASGGAGLEGKGIEGKGTLSADADAADPAKADPAKQPAAADAGKAGAGKAAKTKPKGEKPEHAEVRAYFCERWKSLRGAGGADYPWKFGREDKHLQWVLDQVGRDAARAREIVEAFIGDDDPWLCERGHDFALLVSRFAKYRARPQAAADPDNGHVFERAQKTEAEYDELLRGAMP